MRLWAADRAGMRVAGMAVQLAAQAVQWVAMPVARGRVAAG